jgi:predicted outer membrane protein
VLVSRKAAGTLFVGGALSLTLGSLLYPAMLGVQKVRSAPERVIATPETGPLTEADRDFVVKVRSAGLWEYPVGQTALRKGTTKAVKTAGKHLLDGDASLDAAARRAAGQLGITLPNQPSPQQQGFVAKLNADSGKQFDTDMATLLRATDGQLLSTIASVRTTTKNTLVRALADQANGIVLDLITVLEKTGLVDFDQVLFQETTAPTLPARDMTPPPPAATQPQVVLTPPANSTLSPSPSVR